MKPGLEKRSSPWASLSRTTPVPNYLLDEALPLLSGAEVKVLLVVLRQTAGWSVGGDWRVRKERDWITQSQFKAKAGLGSEAVSRAIDLLVRRGLLEVTAEGGAPLPTPAARRACRGRLYFRAVDPGEEARAVHFSATRVRETDTVFPGSSSETGIRPPDTTKREMYKAKIRRTLEQIKSEDK